MKKLIRFTMMLLMIAGVFIFAQGSKVEAATDTYDGFNLYTFDDSPSNIHDIPDSRLDINNWSSVFVDGLFIGNGSNQYYGYTITSSSDGVRIYDPIYDENFTIWNSSSGYANTINNDINRNVIIFDDMSVSSISERFYVESDQNNHLFGVDQFFEIEQIDIFIDGVNINDLDGYSYGRETGIYLYIMDDIGDSIFFYDDETLVNELSAYVLIVKKSSPVNEYTITFDTAGGSAVDPVTATEGAMLGEVIWDPGIVTTKDGYTFDDWYKNASYTIPVTESDTVTTDLTVYANWIQDIINFTVTFNSVGGSYIAPEEIQENSCVSQPTDPLKEGYLFGGWYTDAFFLNAYDFDDPVTSNLTLYAQWTQLADEEVTANDWIADNILLVLLGVVVLVIIFKR